MEKTQVYFVHYASDGSIHDVFADIITANAAVGRLVPGTSYVVPKEIETELPFWDWRESYYAARHAETLDEERRTEWDVMVGSRFVGRYGPGLTVSEVSQMANNLMRSGWYRGGSSDYHHYDVVPATPRMSAASGHDCNHITCNSRRSAILAGGRYWDGSRWVCLGGCGTAPPLTDEEMDWADDVRLDEQFA